MKTAIDLFAGAGGFTTGAEAAGLEVRWAANHWPLSVQVHKRNHAHVQHACQDLQQADFTKVPAHDVLLASPSCVGHTNARGKELPHHDAARATAWAVVTCAEVHRAPVVVVENVPEFANWSLYPSWCDAMRRLGYALSPHVLDAADFGVPQHRVRLFIVATQSSSPVQLRLPKLTENEYAPVAGVINWDDPKWTPIDKPGRSKATLARVRSGRNQFGDRFVMPYYSSGSGLTGRSIHRPLGTLTTKSRWAVVDGDRMRMLQPYEAKKVMGFPDDYALTGNITHDNHLIGNAVSPPKVTALLNAIRRAA